MRIFLKAPAKIISPLLRILGVVFLVALASQVVGVGILYLLPPLPEQHVVVLNLVIAVAFVFSILFALLLFFVVKRVEEAEETNRRLADREELYRALVNDQTELICRFDRKGKLIFANRAFAEYFNVGAETLVGSNVSKFIPNQNLAWLRDRLKDLTIGNPVHTREIEYQHPDGSLRSQSWTTRGFFQKDGTPRYYQVVGRDITQRVETLRKLQHAHSELEERSKSHIQLLSTALEAAANGVMITDRNGNIEWVNPAFIQMTGYTFEEVLGKKPSFLSSGAHSSEFYDHLWQTILNGDVWRGETINRRKDGSVYVEEQTIAPVSGRDRAISHFIAIKDEVTERKHAEEDLRKRYGELTLLNEVSRVVSDTLDLGTLLRNLEVLLAKTKYAQGWVIYSYDESTDCLSLEGFSGFSQQPQGLPEMIPIDEFHSPDVLQRRESKLVRKDELVDSYRYPFMPDDSEWATCLCLPLISKDQVQGVLELYSQSETAIQEEEIQFCEALANQVGVAFQNARLYKREMQARQAAELLRQSGFALARSLEMEMVLDTLLEYLPRLVPYDHAYALLVHGDNQLSVRAARWAGGQKLESALPSTFVDVLPGSVLHRTLRNGKSVSIHDVWKVKSFDWPFFRETVRSWLGVPIISRGDVIGLYAIDRIIPRAFTDDHIRQVETLVSQAAVAIQNAWLFEQVRSGHERLQALSRRLVEVQESERRYIAQELHDEAGQALTTLLVGLELLEGKTSNPEVISAIKSMNDTVASVLENLHRLAVHLRPASLDQVGLIAALNQHLDGVVDKYNLKVQFEAVGINERIHPEVETALYRIVQEAVTNIIRHARATRVDVLLQARGSDLILLVEDDGVGFDPHEPVDRDRLGLFGMRERVDALMGSLEIESSSSCGTTIRVQVPNVYPGKNL